jgi:hypothetical protein
VKRPVSATPLRHASQTRQNMRKSKKEILQQQENQKRSVNEIASIVQRLRLKSDWMIKISDPEIRLKYRQEAQDQGIPEESVEKALSILDTMAKCQAPRAEHVEKLLDEDIFDVKVVVGGEQFILSTNVLTADSESMLNRMFSPPWMKPIDGEPILIETLSNSPVIFSHIITYLDALKNHQTNLCPNFHSLSSEDVTSLRNDCDYLGLRRLSIAISIPCAGQEKEIVEQQKKAAMQLSKVTMNLQNLQDEKRRLEKRFAQLPELIAAAESELEAEKERRNVPQTQWTGQPGDEVIINTTGNNWEQFTLVEVDGVMMAELSPNKKRKWTSMTKPNAPIPLPERAFYHPLSSQQEFPCESETVTSVMNILPSTLSRSLEYHLDALLHKETLDLHPGSDGQVVDLIHPSLYPYIKGLTQVSNEEEFSKCVPVKGDYCWLPSEFVIDESGNVNIDSYINNLSREKYPELYVDIAQTFQAMLPLYEDILFKSLRSRTLQVIVKAAYYFIPPGETYEGWICSDFCHLLLMLPPPPSLPPHPLLGSWHVEGMPHENIIASGIYYISASNNIENNYLEFRTLNDEESYYGESGREGEEVNLVENIGSVETPTGKIIVWENSLQHKVGPLTVPAAAAAQGAGVRKILCFFLVSPKKRIVSTKIVPEQQSVIPLNVAMEHRQKLMNERKYIATQNAEDWETRTYTFCEH